MEHPATKKRGGDPDVKHTPAHEKPDDAAERKLEQGLEESMAGSDPVSITQPSKSKVDKQRQNRNRKRAVSPLSDLNADFAQKPAIWPAFRVVAPPSVTI